MPSPLSAQTWRTLVARHLFGYLAVLAGIVVVVSIVLGRADLGRAVAGFDPRWVPAVLGLSLFNYGLRFLKWHRMLRDVGVRVPLAGNARLYFACLAMVVTPMRLGELYKVVFLRRLHGVRPEQSLPPLVLERVTDALAVLALVAVQPFVGAYRVLGVVAALLLLVGVGWILAHDRWRRMVMGVVTRFGPLRSRAARIESVVAGHAQLLVPRSLAPNLVLSTISWWAECLGLFVICTALGASIGIGDATWIYALSTLLGNLTFLPGGLGGTEVSLLTLLRKAGASPDAALGATALVRAATLWFAVGVGLIVTLIFRRRLQWEEVTEEAARNTSERPLESTPDAGTIER